MSILFEACAPPFKTFIIGTGNVSAYSPPRNWNNSWSFDCAIACAQAIDVPSIAFAPNLPLFFVPSNSIRSLSISINELYNITIPSSDSDVILSLISSLTLATAFCTPFPKYLDLSPSLNSTASNCPVDAPDGTFATPLHPFICASTITVGFPLESNISLACTFSI